MKNKTVDMGRITGTVIEKNKVNVNNEIAIALLKLKS